ncbi:DNA mismatch repair protein MSH6 [Nematocida minor]|uniref:DNA mismatch repair protein MSH6 n=1 Tax=Nematocida minor TaxID=1912983 RepID=UPI00221EE95C|nr:DNA mismatch repair protein MSH6 [Nematocida minor]KAI5190423.1 DNA mismatch repair protein MSH6 [Nematocida minor]
MQSKTRKCGILSWVSKKPKSTEEMYTEIRGLEYSQAETSQESICLSQISVDDASQKENVQNIDNAAELAEQRNIAAKIDRKDTKKERPVLQAHPSFTEEPEENAVTLSFLSPPKDKFGRAPDDANYDATTLFISSKELSSMTPCEEQFWRIKMEYFDTIVLFKKGKFYELFENDAVLSSELFGLKLTKRGSMRMTGIPEMSLDTWTDRFISKGYKVAIVDQKETSVSQNMRVKSGECKQKIIERELKEVVTETTASAEGAGVCSLFIDEIEHTEKVWATIAGFRPMESEFYVLTFEDDRELFAVKSVIKKENIRDIITDRMVPFKENIIKIRPDIWEQDVSSVMSRMSMQKIKSTEKNALSVLISYLQYLKYAFTPQLVEYSEKNKDHMYIDGRTIEMLCLVEEDRKRGKKQFSLMAQIDQTKTKQGKRLLRQWIIRPLACLEKIEKRYSTAEVFEKAPERSPIESCLQNVYDINDFVKKAKNYKIRPDEIRKFVHSLKSVEKMYPLLNSVAEAHGEQKISRTCIPEILARLSPYAVYNEIICGFDIANDIMPLDTDPELIAAEKYKQKVLNILETYGKNESKAAGVDFAVKKIGREHYLECKYTTNLPPKYIPAGSTKNTSRYTTPELRRLSESYLEAEEKITFLATESVARISKRISENDVKLKDISLGVAALDCLISFVYINGVKPVFSESLEVEGLTNVRHTHISNNLKIGTENKLVVVTGPNMAGKSTFLRNVSVAIILRQIGAKAPATRFSAPIYDRMFTRIGASDNLIEGESTFQVEMKETADILVNATDRSFVIIDELGRGTSTREGSAISLAVKEYLKKIGCTALYATHFFSAIASSDVTMKMDYTYTNNNGKEEILYLYKLVEGVCRDSCGIDICKITKVPAGVISRALEIKKARRAVLLNI